MQSVIIEGVVGIILLVLLIWSLARLSSKGIQKNERINNSYGMPAAPTVYPYTGPGITDNPLALDDDDAVQQTLQVIEGDNRAVEEHISFSQSSFDRMEADYMLMEPPNTGFDD